MAQDETNLYNLALSAAGSRGSISAPNERSREAEICSLWYEPVRRQVLRAAPWASVRASARLTLLQEQTETWSAGNPNPAYRFAYALPEKMLTPRYLYGFARFELSLLSSQRQAIMTSVESPILYYSFDQKLIAEWDPDLYIAIAHALAAFIALPLNGKTQQARAAQAQANAMILAARESAANEQFEPDFFPAESLVARGSAYTSSNPRFIFPSGPLIAVPNV